MSAECHDCGNDLVYTSDWPSMECPVCTVAADRDRYRDLLVRILSSYEDGTINVPDVDAAIEAEIREALR